MLMFTQGQIANCSSLIVSHVWNEAGIFIKPSINTTAAFTDFLETVFPGNKMQKIRDSIEARYPPAGPPFHGDQQSRVRKMVQDSTFVCNSRQLYDAYKGQIYVMQYNFPPAFHGSDLLASSYHQGIDIAALIKSYIDDVNDVLISLLENIIQAFAVRYQRYFASHALSGDPNTLSNRGSPTWEIAEDAEGLIDKVLKAGIIGTYGNPFFSVGEDRESSAVDCDFWKEVAQEIGNLYIEENSFAHESGIFKGLSGMQVQKPEKGTPVISDL